MWLLITAAILGIGFVGLLPKNVGRLLKISLAPALGLFVFTHLVLLISFLIGVNCYSIIASLVISAILFLICFLRFKEEIQFNNFPIIFILISFVVSVFLSYIWLTQVLSPSSEGFKTGGGGMYGDTALHAAYTSRLETGKFPIQNPLFAGSTLIYPLANDLLSATLKIAGLNFNLAFSLPQILFLISFLALFYQIAKKFTSNWGFLIALLILFLGWGIGALFFFKEWAGSDGSFWHLLTRDYTDISQYNLYFHNILTGLVLPERSFLPGLFFGLLMFLNFTEYFQSKNMRFLLINGVILGSLPFWHTHTFIFFSITSLIFAIWSMRQDLKKTFTHFFFMFVTTLIFALPFLFLFFSNHSVVSFLHITFGWQNGNENLLIFWLKNSFLTIPLALLGFWGIKREQKIFFVPAFVIFIIANLIIFQPWDWDNIKLLSWSFLFFAILVGFLLAKFAQRGIIASVVVWLLVLISVASGSLSLALQLKNRFVVYDKADIDLADWANKNSKINEVFLIEPFPNHPIPGLSGRLVYLGYPGHLWVHGIDYGKREQEVNQILAGDTGLIKNLEVPIDYLVITNNKLINLLPLNSKEVYQNQKYIVYKL